MKATFHLQRNIICVIIFLLRRFYPATNTLSTARIAKKRFPYFSYTTANTLSFEVIKRFIYIIYGIFTTSRFLLD